MLRFLTAGESHGKGLVVILEGMPAGLHIDLEAITEQLKRRQGGYGRGRRMAIESDKAEVLSGVRAGETLGSPISLLIRNKDWENWQQTMHAEDEAPAGATGAVRPVVTRPRPGHADLAGAIKYDRTDIRDVLSARARERPRRVSRRALSRQLLRRFDVGSSTTCIAERHRPRLSPARPHRSARDIAPTRAGAEPIASRGNMIAEIDRYRMRGIPRWRIRCDCARFAGRLGSYVPGRSHGRLAHRPSVCSRHQGSAWHRSERGVGAGSQMHDDIVRRRAARSRRSAWRVRRTMPEGSKAASPTAKT